MTFSVSATKTNISCGHRGQKNCSKIFSHASASAITKHIKYGTEVVFWNCDIADTDYDFYIVFT